MFNRVSATTNLCAPSLVLSVIAFLITHTASPFSCSLLLISLIPFLRIILGLPEEAAARPLQACRLANGQVRTSTSRYQ